MKRFHFSLHTVKAIRAHGEVHAREKLAEAVKVAADAQAELANWQQRLSLVESRLSDHRIGRFNGSDVASQLVAYRNDCASRDDAIAALRAARAALTASRDGYVKAKRELEVMEKLEKRARAAHTLETARAEQAELDEFAGRMNHSQFARR